jgi:hypothetical protein
MPDWHRISPITDEQIVLKCYVHACPKNKAFNWNKKVLKT